MKIKGAGRTTMIMKLLMISILALLGGCASLPTEGVARFCAGEIHPGPEIPIGLNEQDAYTMYMMKSIRAASFGNQAACAQEMQDAYKREQAENFRRGVGGFARGGYAAQDNILRQELINRLRRR